MAVFASDNFTGTNGTALESHTPSGGGSWSKHASHAGSFEIQGNRCRLASANTGRRLYYHSGTPGGANAAEYDVAADLVVNSAAANRFLALAGRIDTGADTFYFAAYRPVQDVITLFKRVAGTETNLGSYTFTGDVSFAWKLELRDAAKKVYVDGVERISSTDNAITAAGKAGLGTSTSSAAGNDQEFDNFSATDLSSGSSAALEATVSCTGAVTAILSTDILMLAFVTASASPAAALTTDVRMQVQTLGSASAQGAMATDVLLAAVVVASATTSSDIDTSAGSMVASMSCATTAGGSLETEVRMAAAVVASVVAQAPLGTDIRMEASCATSASAAAGLETEIRLAAAVETSVQTTGGLTTAVLLVSSVVGSVFVTAHLASGSQTFKYPLYIDLLSPLDNEIDVIDPRESTLGVLSDTNELEPF